MLRTAGHGHVAYLTEMAGCRMRARDKVLDEALCVAEVLAEWILELKFFPKMGCRPLRGVFVAENPAVVVLRFDDKDAVA